MKIETSSATPTDAQKARRGLQRILCLSFLLAAVVAAVGAFGSPRPNQGSMGLSNVTGANIIVVTNTNDSGTGSLRDALAVANDGDTIDATGVSGTIVLTSGELQITHSVTITGSGSGNLAVDGNKKSRVFYMNLSKTIFVSGLTITNGSTGIYNDGGALTLSDCTVSGNSGPGVRNDSLNGNATMTIANSTIRGNFGPGVSNSANHAGTTSSLTVSNCTVSGNSGAGIGNGAAFGGSATTTLTNSTISGNSGGGLGNRVSGRGGASLAVSNCTVSGNSGSWGGGIANSDATLTITSSTLSGNSADWGGAIATGSGQGGGARVTVTNSTISGNWASYGGGGIINEPTCCGGSTVIVTNSTISGNSAVDGGGIYNVNRGGGALLALDGAILKAGSLGENIFNAGTVSSHGYNVSSDDGGGYLTGPGDQINTDPLLGLLQDNGGPTFTHALLPGSPAIDAGDPNFTPPPLYDQRGPDFARVANSRIDIGSFEVQRKSTPTPTPCSSWSPGAPVPYNAGGMFAASDGTYVYTGAGGDINAGHNDLLRYDPGSGSWTPLAPSPDQHALSQAVYFKGKLYNMGGFLGDLSQVSNTTRIYNIATNTWKTGKPMPATLGAPATMLWNGVIYIAGGFDGTQRVDTLYAYDIASDAWSTLAPMPQALYAPGFGAINGKLYVAGGYAFGPVFNTLQIYDIATDTWTLGPNVPQGVGYCGSTVFNGQLYLYGGIVQSNPRMLTNITQIYDPVSNTWSTGPAMNVTRWWVYGTAVGNQAIVAPGGVNANIIGFNDNEQLINTPCGTPTPTPTATATPTPTPTPTPTARPSSTPRPRPTPHPRPTV